MIPVDRTVTDPFYRYMMPELQCTHESHRTVLTNIHTIAKSLYRETSHLVRFISINLGCKSINENGKFTLQGIFDSKRLQQLIFDFIDIFVLCVKCRNPETRFVVLDGHLRRTCSSCGETFLQSNSQINSMIERSIGSLSNADLKYDKNNHSNIHELIQSSDDQSDAIYELFIRESFSITDVFSTYVKPSEMMKLKRVIETVEPSTVLAALEDMLDASEKWTRLPSFLKVLVKMGWSVETIEKYFSKPRKNKKRSSIIKKGYEQFLDEYCDE